MPTDIDRRVAEEVMGFSVSGDRYTLPGKRGYLPIPNFSTDMNATMEVVEKMRERGWPWFMLRYDAGRKEELPCWTAVFHNHDNVRSDADTPAMAICLAALEAVK